MESNETWLRFAASVEASDDSIVSHDLSGTIRSWNRAAERLFGYAKDEAIGQPIRLIIPVDRYEEDDDTVRRIRAGESVSHHDAVLLRKHGQRIDVSLSVSPIATPEGEIIGVSKVARDITEKKRFERDARHLAALVESSDDAIVSKDLNGIVTSWNPAAERMFGFSADEMLGQSIRRLIPLERQDEEDDVLSRIRRGERVEHYETIRRRKDGELIPVSLTVSPIRRMDGTIVGASKIARDIGDRKRAEAERHRLLRIAQESSRLKDEFLATLSHELRTPLNAIVGYIRMMQSGLLNAEKHKRALNTVARNISSLTQIVEDVLDVSRIVSGKIRLEAQSVDMRSVIEAAVETVRPAADAKGVRVEVAPDPSGTSVWGDPERLQQILWNLLSNAVKFTDRGGKVHVEVAQANSDIEVTISDTGAGIAPDFLPHVFERFRQADASMSRTHGGLGLGLAITRHLVELQGGRITAASDGLGKGSTFRVVLPGNIIAADPVHGHERPYPARAHTHIVVPELRGVRILAVDDDRDALALVREILETTGATVTTADSAVQALRAIERTRPDVLLADLGMPEMNGFDLIDWVRRSDRPEIRDIPAAALTAYARSEERTKALRSGFQMHLAKPVDPGELMAAMAALSARTPTHD